MTGGPEPHLDANTRLGVERTYLSHERTLMAWIRTSVSLIGFGFSIQQFFRVARASQPPNELIGPYEFGFLMMVIGLIALTLAVLQNRADLRLMDERYRLSADGDVLVPRSRARIFAALVALLGIIGLLSMVLHA
jgi:putative membrane protein